MGVIAAGIVFVSGAAIVFAADQIIVDRHNVCQISVPANWKTNAILKGAATSPDKADSVVLSSTTEGQSLGLAKSVMQSVYKPVKVLEDTSGRFWYEYEPADNQNGKTRGWYVGIPVKSNVCGAQITMKDGNEALAKTIAASMKAK